MNLQKLFDGIDKARLAVIGDFCLDVYWIADMKRSVLSREVPHYPLPIVQERMSPGGAGNVVMNMLALKPASVKVIGIIGSDWRGSALKELLSTGGADISNLICDNDRVTNTYIKPMRTGISDVIYEDPRLDFENYSPISSELEDKLITAVNGCDFDILCVCDQMKFGSISDRVREAICAAGKEGKRIIVDSRDRIGLYENVIIKPNEVEASTAANNCADYKACAEQLYKKTNRDVIITLGAQGCMTYDGEKHANIPAFYKDGEIDICGAGDTFMAAVASALASGADMIDACKFGNAASLITVHKLRTTGTATRDEVKTVLS